ncbi:structural maintenance of chromosomes protein 6 [Drosophila albomicans]|uniref:Structural maintenance of chromosomes protein 6 n=1 Tax=Drosophila albomicans TaxID=7291 RepID=A0A6P8XLB6_DROAB|nr:structural maintenance of chromosomes protein 6 [Drosophila albomicans]
MVRGKIRKKQLRSESDSDDGPASKKRLTENAEVEDNIENEEMNYEPSTSSAATAENRSVGNSNSMRGWVRRESFEEPSMGLDVDNPFNRCGKIISMRLRNFMCHSNFRIDFGPNINFLVGSNGSGKSAVITALALAMAASARSTSRASSIQKLIKNGETTATIELTLSNTGVRPYKYNMYGPHMTVIRHIRQASSTYELKDARRQTVSRKLDDIRRMLLYFGISVENPIFVLNQEASREFLKDLEPASNYKLLMKATQLDLCANSLTQCHEQSEHFNQDVDILQMKKKKLSNACREEEEKLTMLKNKEAIKVQLKDAKTMLAWLKVTRIQTELTKMEHSLKIIEKKNCELLEKTTQKDLTQDSLSKQVEVFNAAKEEIQKRYEAQDAKLRSAKRVFQDCLMKGSSIRANINNVDKRLKEEEATYEGCKRHMNNYHADYTEVKRLRESNNAKLVELKAKVEQNNNLIAQLREEQNDMKGRLPAAKEHVEYVRNELVQLQKKEQSLQFDMESLLRNKSNKMSVYGDNALKVAMALKNQYGKNDHLMPRGPIGMYITVPNSKYRDLIENQLSHCLRSYIVNSDKDRISLRAILQRTYTSGIPTIVTSAFSNRVYNVSKHKVQASGPNMTVLMDEIRCDDPVVMNYLIDTMRIETVLVTDSKETAEFLTSNSENIPPNMSRILVPSLGLEYCPSPNYAVYSIRINSARFIQVNVDDRIQQMNAEQTNVRERSAMLQPQYADFKRALDIDIQAIKQKSVQIEAHHSEITKSLPKIMDIENFEYRELPALNVLETHLASSAEKMEKCKQEYKHFEEQLREINERKALAEHEVNGEQSALHLINQKALEIDAEQQELQNKIRDLDRNFEENQRRFKRTNELMQSMLGEQKDLKMNLENARQEAEKVGDFIETNKTEEKIRDKISNYKAKIKHFESMNIVSEEVQSKLTSLHENLQALTEHLNQILSIVEKLRLAYRTRAQRFIRSRFHFFTMVQFQFKQALACRRFDGDLTPDHKQKTLEIKVYPPSGNKTANTKSLSGGERSFTTVSLLKGLWSTSDHPFYFLDEYDVFTDEVNRTFITKLLIQEGLDFQNRQYCFLTPQDTKVDAHPLIKIHKLATPEH